MKRIRVISLAVIAALSLTVNFFCPPTVSPQQQSAAAYLREAGIMLGNESGDMMLEQGLTRAQMAAMLTRVVADPEQFERDSTFLPQPMQLYGRSGMGKRLCGLLRRK